MSCLIYGIEPSLLYVVPFSLTVSTPPPEEFTSVAKTKTYITHQMGGVFFFVVAYRQVLAFLKPLWYPISTLGQSLQESD
jgi:hypothetical protein